MDVYFARSKSLYDCQREQEPYEVDVEVETYACTDFQQYQPDGGCKHLVRRKDLEIWTGPVPPPDVTCVQ